MSAHYAAMLAVACAWPEAVKVLLFLHVASGTLGLTMKQHKMSDGKSRALMKDMGEPQPFLLPWRRIGDQHLLGWD